VAFFVGRAIGPILPRPRPDRNFQVQTEANESQTMGAKGREGKEEKGSGGKGTRHPYWSLGCGQEPRSSAALP